MRGRATLRAAFRGQGAGWVTAAPLAGHLPHWLRAVLTWDSSALLTASAVTVLVVIAWNLLAPAGEDERTGGRPRPVQAGAGGDGSLAAALRRAQAAGTFSVNGRRFIDGVMYAWKSGCDVCGRPTDAAWYHSSVPHLCRRCAQNRYFLKYGI